MKTKRQWHTTLNHSMLAGVLISGASVAWAGDYSFFTEKKTPASVEEDSVPTTITPPPAKKGSLSFPTSKADIVNALTKPSKQWGISSLISNLSSSPDAPPKAGAMVRFDIGSAIIQPDSYSLLRSFGEALTEDLADAIVEIEGHTDSVGSASRNWKLSKKRAKAVKDHLIDFYGIDPNRLIVSPKGETDPFESNRTREGRAQNRRVVFVRVD